ncbi:MAG: ABC transporter ATP-binding protein, partial [Raoultibacter sp.]
MKAIEMIDVTKRFANTSAPAVDSVSLSIDEGEFITILGTSGCGKTTLLKMVNRLYEPTSGTISLFGENIATVDKVIVRRRIGYVIQQVGLFPHMTIADNIATVPTLLKWEKAIIEDRVTELLTLVGLNPQEYRSRYPSQLSGGQQQRVGLARALAADPKIMLLDEPFGAIDAITRTSLQDELLRLHR